MAENQNKRGAATSPSAPAKKPEYLAPKSGYSLTTSCDLVNKYRTEIFDTVELVKKDGKECAVLTNKDGTITMTVPTYLVDARDNPETSQILDILRIQAYKKQCQLITLDVQEYMQMRGLSDAKAARKRLDDAIEALWNGEIEYTNTAAKKHEAKVIKLRILQSIQKSRGRRLVEFSAIFYALLTTEPGAFVFQYPLPLLATDNRNRPNAYYIGVRLAELYKKRNTIAVATLLKACKDLPTVDEVRTKGKRQYKKRIQVPFERDLNSITCLKWEYVDKAENPYTPKTFTDFLNTRIKFEFIGYPKEEQDSCEKMDKGVSR